MSYFADFTPHVYTPVGNARVLNVGWLDAAYQFPRGDTSQAFKDALHDLCQRPVWPHRGFHLCQFCRQEDLSAWPPEHPERRGNGQIRVMGINEIWYSAPTLIHHYVVAHQYQPPQEFIEAVLSPVDVAISDDAR